MILIVNVSIYKLSYFFLVSFYSLTSRWKSQLAAEDSFVWAFDVIIYIWHKSVWVIDSHAQIEESIEFDVCSFISILIFIIW